MLNNINSVKITICIMSLFFRNQIFIKSKLNFKTLLSLLILFQTS